VGARAGLKVEAGMTLSRAARAQIYAQKFDEFKRGSWRRVHEPEGSAL
jgi:hypothetical protein